MNYQPHVRDYHFLGNLFRQARQRKKLHLAVVTAKMGYTDCRILESYESGEKKVPITDLPVLAKTLNLPLRSLCEITSGYHPGLVERAREIGRETFDIYIDDQLMVAIILCGIENKQSAGTRH